MPLFLPSPSSSLTPIPPAPGEAPTLAPPKALSPTRERTLAETRPPPPPPPPPPSRARANTPPRRDADAAAAEYVWTVARWASADKSVSCPLEARPARIDAPSAPRRSGLDHVSNTADASHRRAYIEATRKMKAFEWIIKLVFRSLFEA